LNEFAGFAQKAKYQPQQWVDPFGSFLDKRRSFGICAPDKKKPSLSDTIGVFFIDFMTILKLQ